MSRCLLKAFPGIQREKEGREEGFPIFFLLSILPLSQDGWRLQMSFKSPSTAPSFLRANEVAFGKQRIPFPTTEYLLSKKCGQARQVHASPDLQHSAHNFGGHGRRAATCPERNAATAVALSRVPPHPPASPQRQLFYVLHCTVAAVGAASLCHMTLWALVPFAIIFSGPRQSERA